MQCYTELTPPTAVTHSLALPFISPNATNLVVAKTSLLQIFSIRQVSGQIKTSVGSDLRNYQNGEQPPISATQTANSSKLILIAEYALSGTVTSMCAVKAMGTKSGAHAILLGFRDAKLSLIEWDPERNGISTLSLHYFERDDVADSPWATALSDTVNYLTVDPSSRCAALTFGMRNLAILPFRQDDEDVHMDDWDEDLDGPRPIAEAAVTNGDSASPQSPYGTSFVLSLSTLDTSLLFPIHLAFLYEYREPTFGILSSKLCPSTSLLQERKDHVSYMVFTLDLHQKASTTILAVHGLPYDLSQIVALPTPIGGALVVGSNELIHIDQSGKTNGIAVNTFAKQTTAFGLADQSHLNLHLEGCLVEQLSVQSGEVLLVLQSGDLCILGFRMDGRSVSGLSVRRVDRQHGGELLHAPSSCVTRVAPSTIFLGSEYSDSVLLGWSQRTNNTDKRRLRSEKSDAQDRDFQEDDEDDEEDEDDDDDDLYGDTQINTAAGASTRKQGDGTSIPYTFRVHDTLLNMAPLKSLSFGSATKPSDADASLTGDLQLVAATGNNTLYSLKGAVETEVVGRFEFKETQGIWTVHVKKPAKLTQTNKNPNVAATIADSPQVEFDIFMIVSKTSTSSEVDVTVEETSDVYGLNHAGFEALTGTEFEPAAGATIEVGTLGKSMRLIQVLRSEVRCYDGALGLVQILPMFDEESGAEPKIVSASIIDPYLLLLRDDASIFLASCDDRYEIEEIEREDDALLSNEWLGGCLYKDTTGIFHKSRNADDAVVMFLMSTTGTLLIYVLPDLKIPIYKAEAISFLPPTIAPRYIARRSQAQKETITELLVADLGDEDARSPYMILRSASDDVIIYEPFRKDDTALSASLHFNKVNNPRLAKSPEVAASESRGGDPSRANPMRAIANIGGFSSVLIPGSSASFILRSAKSMPRVIRLRGPGIRGFSSFHTAGCDRGFISVDMEGIARVCQMPAKTNYDLGMPLTRIPFDGSITSVRYHAPSDTYVIATSTFEPFHLPKDDDHHREWAREDTDFLPLIERSTIHLISPTNWSIIDSLPLEHGEVALCLEVLDLETSEEVSQRKMLITVGTAIRKGEDLAIKGSVHVYDIVDVVPQPGKPETGKKLKLIAREIIPRGAVTAISEVGSQGFMVIAQGQKCMVRGLKEDGSLLPVAFLDANTHITEIKEVPGTGLCAVSDARKGVWLVGYTEEPYKMMLMGKQTTDMEIVAVNFLPTAEGLYVVAADSDCNLHVLQFDPEHPKSLYGQHLLHRTTFSLGGQLPTIMTLLPTTAPTLAVSSEISQEELDDRTNPTPALLISTTTGVLALLTSLAEDKYRRLSALASLLTNSLYHPAGLNSKMFRIDGRAPESVVGGRAVVDGCVLERLWELSVQRRAEVLGRVGEEEIVREDLEGLRAGLDFL